jgi:hypothetical protein
MNHLLARKGVQLPIGIKALLRDLFSEVGRWIPSKQLFLDGMGQYHVQGARQVVDVLATVALRFVHHERPDLGSGDTI